MNFFKILWYYVLILSNPRQIFVLMKKSWKHLQGVFRLRLQKTSSRPVQDVLIKTNIFALNKCLQKTSLRRVKDILSETNLFVLTINLQDVFKTFSKRFQDVFKTYSRRLAKTSWRHLGDVFKTCARRVQNVFKVSCKNLFKASSVLLQDILKTFCKDVFKTISIHITKITVLVIKSCRRIQHVSKMHCKEDYLQRFLLIYTHQDLFHIYYIIHPLF